VTARSDRLEFRILGTVEAWLSGRSVRLTGMQRSLLAVLLLNPGRIVAGTNLVEKLWGEQAPASASARLRMLVLELRRTFAEVGARPDLIATRTPGYLLQLDGAWLDSEAFAAGVEDARKAVAMNRSAEARELYSRALQLWRGPALSGARGPLVEAEASRLEEEHVAAIEGSAGVDLALGRYPEAVAALTDLVRRHPLRDGPHGQLMLALHRSGRSGAALEIYRTMHRRYAEELGIEPGPELQRLHQQILRAEPVLAAPDDGPPAPSISPGLEPPAVTGIRPAQLPPDISDFTGRDQQIEAAMQALAPMPATDQGAGPTRDSATVTTVPILAVYGKPGVGKSAFSVHVAHRIRWKFPDGQLHIDLRGDADRPERSHDVLARFLGALGVPGAAIPDHPADRAALFRSRTADQRILIVLDNAADETQVLPLLPGMVGCAVVITSRVPLAALPGARRFALDVLDADACRRLLEAILGVERTDAERSNVDLLAAHCGGLPLALRVAAGRLAAQPHWLVKTLVDRLADERHRLDELRLGGMEVRASLQLSTRALPAADGAAFALLGLLPPGDFASWVLAALLDGSVGEAEQRLDLLVRVQLVEYCGRDATGQARYRLHDLIRAYAVELADGRGSSDAVAPAVPDRQTAIERLHGAWMDFAAQAARRLFPRNVTPVPEPARGRPVPGTDALTLSPAAWLESERRSLVAAVRADAPASEPANGFAWQIASLTSEFLETRGYFDDMRSLHLHGLRAAERAGDVRAEAAMRHGLATVDSYEHNLTGARDGYTWALETYRQLGDGWGCAQAEHGVAKVMRWTGEIDEALAGCDRAIDGFLAAGDELEASSARRTAAVIHYERGSWDLAVELAEQALQGYTRAGDLHGKCGVWGVLGLAIARQGRHERAERYLRSAVDAASELDLVLDHAYAGRALGDLYVAQGHGTRARELFEMGVDVMRTVGSRAGEAGFLRRLARLAAEGGQLDTALTLASQAVDLSKPDGAGLYAHSLWALGDVYAARGDEAAATAAWRESRELFRQLGSAEGPPEH